MIEAARLGRDKHGVLQCAVVSQLGHSLNVVTSSSHGSSNQPISFLKLHRDMALRVAQALCSMGGGGVSCVCYTGAVRPPPPPPQSLNREGRWGTTDDFATSFLYFSLFFDS